MSYPGTASRQNQYRGNYNQLGDSYGGQQQYGQTAYATSLQQPARPKPFCGRRLFLVVLVGLVIAGAAMAYAYVQTSSSDDPDNVNYKTFATASLGGYVAAGAGDANGDGISDALFGNAVAGSAFLFYGRSSPSAGSTDPDWRADPINLKNLNGTNGFRIFSSQPRIIEDVSYNIGWNVGSAGDVNGDLLDDFLVACPACTGYGYLPEALQELAPENATDDVTAIQALPLAGQVFLMFGSKPAQGAPSTFDVYEEQDSGKLVTLNGTSLGGILGLSLDGGQDVNGDGMSDFILADFVTNIYYVNHTNGSANTTSPLRQRFHDVGSFLSAETQGRVDGGAWGEGAHQAVLEEADLSGADSDDIEVFFSGQVYVLLGQGEGSAWPAVLALNNQTFEDDPSLGFFVHGFEHNELVVSASLVGDMNGDGIAELAVGTRHFYPPESAEGEGDDDDGWAYIIFGGNPLFGQGAFDVASLDGSNGFALATSGTYSRPTADAGDVNSDGLNDVLIGNGRYSYLVFGSEGAYPASCTAADVTNSSSGLPAVLIDGQQDPAYVQRTLGGLGDVNLDGIDDVGFGYAYAAVSTGLVSVLFGQEQWQYGQTYTVTPNNLANTGTGVSFSGFENSQYVGYTVAPAGDLNNDGKADFLVGCPGLEAPNTGPYAGSSFMVWGQYFNSSASSSIYNFGDIQI